MKPDINRRHFDGKRQGGERGAGDGSGGQARSVGMLDEAGTARVGLKPAPCISSCPAMVFAVALLSIGAASPDVVNEQAGAANRAFLAQIAPLFCPNITSNPTAIRAYEESNHFRQEDLLNLDRLAAETARELRAFQEQYTLSPSAACQNALMRLGPNGFQLVNPK